jgi:hypothetical protein
MGSAWGASRPDDATVDSILSMTDPSQFKPNRLQTFKASMFHAGA